MPCARVDAHGKHLFIRFEGDLTLHSHLRMTGKWGVHRRGERWRRARGGRGWSSAPREHEVVQFDGPVLELTTDSRTRFDQRIAGLGPDVLGADFDEQRFLRRLREDDQTRGIGDALLDQRNLAGIGNVWKAEACFAAGLDPWRASGAVSDAEARAVAFARERMRQAARDGFQARPRAVYGRAGMPCPRCGTPIRSRGQWDDAPRHTGAPARRLMIGRAPELAPGALEAATPTRLQHDLQVEHPCRRRRRSRRER